MRKRFAIVAMLLLAAGPVAAQQKSPDDTFKEMKELLAKSSCGEREYEERNRVARCVDLCANMGFVEAQKNTCQANCKLLERKFVKGVDCEQQ